MSTDQKIQVLPNSSVNPKVLLNQLLENIDDIESISVMYKKKNATFQWMSSTVFLHDLVMMDRIHSINVDNVIRNTSNVTQNK